MGLLTFFLMLLSAAMVHPLARDRGSPSLSAAVLRTALALGAAAITVGCAAWLTQALWRLGMWPLALVLPLLPLVFLAPSLAGWVAVPLGAPRLARWLADLVSAARPGLLYAARAVCRQRRPVPADVEWLEARCDAQLLLGGVEVAVAALLADARGDRASARLLLRSLADLPRGSKEARTHAAEWLAGDDAERGDWQAIVDRAGRRMHDQLTVDPGGLGLPGSIAGLGASAANRPAGQPVWPATPTTAFLVAVAARLCDAPAAPGRAALVLRWLLAPRRLRTLAPLRRGLAAVTPAPAPAPDDAPAADPAATAAPAVAPGLAGAVDALAAALRAKERGELRPPHVLAAARAWDAVLAGDDAVAALAARARALGAPAGVERRVLDELAERAASELTELVLATTLPLATLDDAASPVVAATVQRVRRRLLEELEVTMGRTAARTRARRGLPALDEWRELLALRAAHARAVTIGGPTLRRMAFPHLHYELTPWLVWLWNDRREFPLSDAATYWLLAEALAVGDAQAIETHTRNAALLTPAR